MMHKMSICIYILFLVSIVFSAKSDSLVCQEQCLSQGFSSFKVTPSSNCVCTNSLSARQSGTRSLRVGIVPTCSNITVLVASLTDSLVYNITTVILKETDLTLPYLTQNIDVIFITGQDGDHFNLTTAGMDSIIQFVNNGGGLVGNPIYPDAMNYMQSIFPVTIDTVVGLCSDGNVYVDPRHPIGQGVTPFFKINYLTLAYCSVAGNYGDYVTIGNISCTGASNTWNKTTCRNQIVSLSNSSKVAHIGFSLCPTYVSNQNIHKVVENAIWWTAGEPTDVFLPNKTSTTGVTQITTGSITTGSTTGTTTGSTTGTTGVTDITTGVTDITTGTSDATPDTIKSPSPKNNLPIIVGVSVGAGVLLLLGIFVVLFLVRSRKPKNSVPLAESTIYANSLGVSRSSNSTYSSIPAQENMEVRTVPIPEIPEKGRSWEVQYDQIQIEKEIGKGSHGVVYLGKWRQSSIAVKQLYKMERNEFENFQTEIRVLMNLRPHANVISFQGIVLDPPCILIEYCAGGSLLYAIRNKTQLIPFSVKMQWLSGIAAGMLHLHQEKIVHRDLAARNVLLAADGSPKISDFGMSRPIDHPSYGSTTTNNTGPLKWMSPESLLHRVYSTKTDVWSWGVVMFEIIEEREPYASLDHVQAATQVISKSVKLELSENAEQTLKTIMAMCLDFDANLRPSFEEIGNMLKLVRAQ